MCDLCEISNGLSPGGCWADQTRHALTVGHRRSLVAACARAAPGAVAEGGKDVGPVSKLRGHALIKRGSGMHASGGTRRRPRWPGARQGSSAGAGRAPRPSQRVSPSAACSRPPGMLLLQEPADRRGGGRRSQPPLRCKTLLVAARCGRPHERCLRMLTCCLITRCGSRPSLPAHTAHRCPFCCCRRCAGRCSAPRRAAFPDIDEDVLYLTPRADQCAQR
jgi:hypothetical protein